MEPAVFCFVSFLTFCALGLLLNPRLFSIDDQSIPHRT
jgi:hypothetical protein